VAWYYGHMSLQLSGRDGWGGWLSPPRDYVCVELTGIFQTDGAFYGQNLPPPSTFIRNIGSSNSAVRSLNFYKPSETKAVGANVNRVYVLCYTLFPCTGYNFEEYRLQECYAAWLL
jgi:hypothetical protein